MKSIFKNSFNFFVIIFAFHFSLRLAVYLFYLGENKTLFSDDFILALSDKNFFEYLMFQHSIPIGNIFISKLALITAGRENLYLFYFILNSIYSFSILIVIIKIHKLVFEKNSYFLTLLLLMTSISFLTYDTWRVDHYDHILILLFSILTLYLSECILKKQNFYFDYKFVILMILLSIFSNLFIVVYLIILSFILIFQKKYKVNFLSLLGCSIIIFFIFSSVLFKNKISINEYTPTSIKGWNFIQRPLYTLGYEKYFDLYLKKLNISKINRLCVSKIKEEEEENLTDKNFDNDYFLSLVLHKCYFDQKKQIYNFEKLREIIDINNITDLDLEKAIENDIFDIKNNKWKFSGGHEDINLRTTVFFHKEAIKIYLSSFFNYPYEMIIGTVSTLENQGVIFTFLNMFRWGSQLPHYYEPQHKDINFTFVKNLQKFLSLFVIVSLILSLIISFNFLKSFILNKKTQNEDALIFLLLVICIGYNLITSFITCCENQRNAVMIYPLIIVISNLSFLLFLKKLKKY